MRIMGGVSVKVMSQPKERKELWGRELQVEGTAYAKSSRWKRAGHLPSIAGKPRQWEHGRPKHGKHEMTWMS